MHQRTVNLIFRIMRTSIPKGNFKFKERHMVDLISIRTKFVIICLHTAKDCIDLPPPKNGAKACDDWMLGRFCTPSCNRNWDFSQRLSPFAMWACGASGTWSPPTRWPDCSSKWKITVL